MSYYRQGPFRPGGSGMAFGVPSLTPYVRLIMIACAAVWFVQFLAARFGFDLVRFLGLVPALVIRGFIWQPLTYMFLHSTSSVFHLVFNMLMLWMFGGELERHWGSKAFLRYYLICGIGGGVAALLLGLSSPEASRSATIGASGAIYGLFVAYGMVFAERTILFMLIFPMKARTMAWIMFAVTFFSVFGQANSGISHIAHLGGAVVGYLYLKRVWRFGEFYRDLKWRLRRRRFKVMPPNDKDDSDRWVH